VKKYLIAATLAVVVFAISAFAASLSVSAGVLQAGQDAIGQCVDEDDLIVKYGKETFVEATDDDEAFFRIDSVTLDHEGSCTPSDASLDYRVVVTGADGVLATKSGMLGDNDDANAGVETVTFDTGFDANLATDIHVIIRDSSPQP
jgi:hypothetical protein